MTQSALKAEATATGLAHLPPAHENCPSRLTRSRSPPVPVLSVPAHTVCAMPTLKLRELLMPFAQGLFDKAAALETLPLTKPQAARLGESMAVDVRKACDIVVPAARYPLVSEAAWQAANDRGVDLHEETWHTQKKFDPKRQVFHYEHMTPVSTVVAQLREASGAEDVLGVLDVGIRVAWILKSENAKLNELGYTHRRPDPAAAYADAGIVLHPPKPHPADQAEKPPEATGHSRFVWTPDQVTITSPPW